MAVAAYATEVYSAGAPVIINGEPTTSLGNGQFQISDASRRVLSPSHEVSAYDDQGDPLKINKLYLATGVIEVDGAPSVVTIDGAFVTLSLFAGSKSYSYELNGDVLETTSFDFTSQNGGFRTRCYGLEDITVSISRYDDLARQFALSKLNRESVYLEIRIGGGAEILQGWFAVENSSLSGDIGSLEEESLNFMPISISNQEAIPVSFSLT